MVSVPRIERTKFGTICARPPSAADAPSAESLLALIISHPHLDHYGLAAGLEVDVPIYVGREAASLLQAA
jgi:glyoxylase-like metal-dependent hydrolase (beta-lactamase superfamily II)